MRPVALLSILLLALPLTALTPASATEPCALVHPQARVSYGGFYAEVRQNGNVWIYQESNGIAGLQRGDTSTLGARDPCVDDFTIPPDTAIY